MTEQAGFKIIGLQAENFKRIKAINIVPDGSTVLITGRNEQGKSSILDAIMAALCGKKQCPDKPVRDGCEKGKVVVDMGKFKVIRTFNADGGGTLKVESADGFNASSPQKMLDTIVGDIAFDPMEFINMGKTAAGQREQKNVLMKMAGLDFSDIDAKLAEIKQQRSNANFRKTAQMGLLESMTFHDDLPADEISVSDLTDKLNEAMAHNAAIQEAKNTYVELNGQVLRQQDHIGSIDDRIAVLQKQIDDYKALKEKEVAKLKLMTDQRDAATATGEPIDLKPIQDDIASVEDKNRRIRANAEYNKAKTELNTAAFLFSQLGEKAKAVEAEKATRLSQAAFPVPGLSVDENGVTYEGIPLSQVNTAKKLEIGVAVSMKLNPKLRVLRMSGNDLDSASLAIISKMVEAEGYQAWVERVDESGKVGIVIEDGMVVTPEENLFP